jgi:hypothetical protein
MLLDFSCKKPESPIVYVQKEMLEYCWFPDGSYWVYEEENTPGWMDSIYSAGAKTSIIPDNTNEGFQSESYGWQLNGTVNTYWQTVIAWGNPPDFDKSYSEMTEFYRDTDPPQQDYIFFWDAKYGPELPTATVGISQNYHDSIVIAGNTYYHAIEVVKSPSWHMIWAKGVGVVKRSMMNGQVWNLVRYRIN